MNSPGEEGDVSLGCANSHTRDRGRSPIGCGSRPGRLHWRDSLGHTLAARRGVRLSTSAEASFQELSGLLHGIHGVAQDPRWHPEGDALFHSLQVYQHARRGTADPQLWAAALLHDVGKGLDGPHELEGAALLAAWMPDRVVWLVRHHLDLLRDPSRTRRKLRGDPRLRDLEALRRWDVAGRDPRAFVCTVEEAVRAVVEVATPVRG